MSDREVGQIKQSIEHSPHSPAGHVHNFEGAYQQIAQLQQNEGGLHGAAFRQDMTHLNQQLHDQGLMPNLDIVGVDQAHHQLITRDRADHQTREQSPDHVNDFGALGSGRSTREAEDAARARMLGLGPITRNPDGSYDVPVPELDARAVAGDFIATIMGGLVPGFGDRSGQRRAPFGMNPWEFAAWNGWPDQPNQEPT